MEFNYQKSMSTNVVGTPLHRLSQLYYSFLLTLKGADYN